MAKFKEGVYYRLVDEDGFINHNSCLNKICNTKIAQFVKSFGNKFNVKADPDDQFTIVGGSYELYSTDSMYRELRSSECAYFEEVGKVEVEGSTEIDLDEAIKNISTDKAFLFALTCMSPEDVVTALNLKIKGSAQ